MEAKVAEQRGLTSRSAAIRGMAVAGSSPTKWASARFAIPKLLERFGLKIDDIGLWELNEAFAVQVIYCRRQAGHSLTTKLNVNGGSISIGHPFGMTGARCTGHALIEGKRRGVKVCRRHHVHRRRPGVLRAVRGLLMRLSAPRIAPVDLGRRSMTSSARRWPFLAVSSVM
jgi:acetyl-CoA acetyltransferase